MSTTTAKNAPTYYKATTVDPRAVGVRILFCCFGGDGVERIGYLGTEQTLSAAGVVPESMFSDVGKSGTKSGRFVHADGYCERVHLSRRGGGMWLARRAHRVS